MIIQDRSEELREGLQKIYEEKISQVVEEAQAVADQDAEEFLHQVKVSIEAASQKTLSSIRSACQQLIASTRLEADREVASSKSELVRAMTKELGIQVSALAVNQKVVLTKKMHHRIIQKIKDQGFKHKEFKISIWRGASIPGCQSSLTELAVRAESSVVVIEDSIEDLLESHHNDIVRIISRHVEDHLD